jgi:hypothetical protein
MTDGAVTAGDANGALSRGGATALADFLGQVAGSAQPSALNAASEDLRRSVAAFMGCNETADPVGHDTAEARFHEASAAAKRAVDEAIAIRQLPLAHLVEAARLHLYDLVPDGNLDELDPEHARTARILRSLVAVADRTGIAPEAKSKNFDFA